MKKYLNNLRHNVAVQMLTVISGLLIVILILLLTSPSYKRVDGDCLVVEQLGSTLWSPGLDRHADALALREKAVECGFPPSMYTVTPPATATYSVGCIDDQIAYIQSGGEARRASAALESMAACTNYWFDETIAAPITAEELRQVPDVLATVWAETWATPTASPTP